MNNFLGGTAVENRTALAAGFAGALLLALSWGLYHQPASVQQLALAFLLVCCIILADHFPIHIRYATKVSLISVPLYLAAALLPLQLALLVAVTGILVADWLTRESRGLLPIDFIQDPARWVIVMFTGNTIVNLDLNIFGASGITLVGAAATMFLLDMATFSLFTNLTTREPFLVLLRSSIAQMVDVESIQYTIGILGALAYHQASWSLLLLGVPAFITYVIFKTGKEMNGSTRELLVNMADAVDLRDLYTGGHSRRVADLCGKILDQLGVKGIEVDIILTAARLHDIGKIGIPDAILLKPAALTPEEWDMMRSHPVKGAELLGRYADFARGYEMVLHHHEHWDGTGYPNGLKERGIPFGARVIAAADAFDAMTTDRPYRSANSTAEAAQVLIRGKNVQWDGEIVDALLAALEKECSIIGEIYEQLPQPLPR